MTAGEIISSHTQRGCLDLAPGEKQNHQFDPFSSSRCDSAGLTRLNPHACRSALGRSSRNSSNTRCQPPPAHPQVCLLEPLRLSTCLGYPKHGDRFPGAAAPASSAAARPRGALLILSWRSSRSSCLRQLQLLPHCRLLPTSKPTCPSLETAGQPHAGGARVGARLGHCTLGRCRRRGRR